MILLPSLNRAHLVKRFFEAYAKTEATAPGIVLVDKNDPRKGEYLKLDLPNGWHISLTDGVTMGAKFAEIFPIVKDSEWIAILNDDHVPVTKNWDQKCIAHLNGTNVVSTNDGLTPDKPWNAPNRICGAIFFSGKIIRTLGWIFPPGLQHLYTDDVWQYMFGRAQCAQVLMDVCVHHDHAYLDEKQRDETYYAVNGQADFSAQRPTGGMWDNDRVVFDTWLKNDAEKDTAKILGIQPKTGLMIAVPSHDGDCSLDFATGLGDIMAALSQHNIYFELARVVGSSLIPHARNSLVDMFLKSRCQKLLFIDADQGFTRNDVLHLFQSNKKIIAGITPHKRYPINFNFEPLEKDKHYFKEIANKSPEELLKFAEERADERGEIEVNRVGTGFMMIDRSVFDILKTEVDHYLPFDDNDQIKHGEYFAMGKKGSRFRGEDWFFTEIAQKNHIPIFINVNSMPSHKGAHVWGMNLAQIKAAQGNR